jgi:hypothetical protein
MSVAGACDGERTLEKKTFRRNEVVVRGVSDAEPRRQKGLAPSCLVPLWQLVVRRRAGGGRRIARASMVRRDVGLAAMAPVDRGNESLGGVPPDGRGDWWEQLNQTHEMLDAAQEELGDDTSVARARATLTTLGEAFHALASHLAPNLSASIAPHWGDFEDEARKMRVALRAMMTESTNSATVSSAVYETACRELRQAAVAFDRLLKAWLFEYKRVAEANAYYDTCEEASRGAPRATLLMPEAVGKRGCCSGRSGACVAWARGSSVLTVSRCS